MRCVLGVFHIVFLLLLGFLGVGYSESADRFSEQILKKPLSLTSLVQKYLTASDRESTEAALSDILQYPDVSVSAVSEAIKQSPKFSTQPVGPQPSQAITVRGRQYRYSLYVPPSYDSAKSYPLIVCLHGAGFTGESYLERWVPRLDDHYILVCPTISMGAWWSRFAEDLVMKIVNTIQTDYHIDRDRIFLTGMSNGGVGAWIIGMHHADTFAGIAPMASGIDDVLFPFLDNLHHTPVYIIHGLHDQVMPVSLSRTLVNEMGNRGIQHVYQEHNFTHPHAGGHFFPREELPALVSWFDRQTRGALPQRVSVVRDATHLTNFSWVRIDATDQIAAFSENLVDSRDRFITEKIYAKLEAEVISSNRIVVKTERVRRYSLFLNNELVDLSKPVIVETNGKRSFEGIMTPNLETLLQEARRRQDPGLLFPAQVIVEVPKVAE
ncbi:carboxylesterase family protein [Nitrospira sp. M1]